MHRLIGITTVHLDFCFIKFSSVSRWRGVGGPGYFYIPAGVRPLMYVAAEWTPYNTYQVYSESISYMYFVQSRSLPLYVLYTYFVVYLLTISARLP